MTARTFIIAAAAAALAAGPVHGQAIYDPIDGVWDGSRWITIETVEDALHVLVTVDDMTVASGPLSDIIAGRLLDLSEAEFDGLADRLGELALADTTEDKRIADRISSELMIASSLYGHAYSFDVLIRIRKGAEVLGFGDRVGLFTIQAADPERGGAYVLEVFEAAEAPPDCFRDAWHREKGDTRPDCTSNPWSTTFCRAGRVLYGSHVRARMKNPEVLNETDNPQSAYEAVGLEPNAARWWDRCWGLV